MAKRKKETVVSEETILEEVKKKKIVSVQDLLRLGRVESVGSRTPEPEPELIDESEQEEISPEEAVTR